VLIDEFLEEFTALPDYLDVKCTERPRCTFSTRTLDSRSRVLIVSVGLAKQNPTGGSSPGTWENRRPEAAWLRLL